MKMIGTAAKSQRKWSERPRNHSEKTRDFRDPWWDFMVWQEKNRNQGKCNVLEASKAPELEKRLVGRSRPELVRMTKASIKESKPLKQRNLPQGLSEINHIYSAAGASSNGKGSNEHENHNVSKRSWKNIFRKGHPYSSAGAFSPQNFKNKKSRILKIYEYIYIKIHLYSVAGAVFPKKCSNVKITNSPKQKWKKHI